MSIAHHVCAQFGNDSSGLSRKGVWSNQSPTLPRGGTSDGGHGIWLSSRQSCRDVSVIAIRPAGTVPRGMGRQPTRKLYLGRAIAALQFCHVAGRNSYSVATGNPQEEAVIKEEFESSTKQQSS